MKDSGAWYVWEICHKILYVGVNFLVNINCLKRRKREMGKKGKKERETKRVKEGEKQRDRRDVGDFRDPIEAASASLAVNYGLWVHVHGVTQAREQDT